MNEGILLSALLKTVLFSCSGPRVQSGVVSGACLWSVPLPPYWLRTAGVKHLPEVVEVKSSLYLKLIRLDNKFNFIAIFSLTVKIQYFSPLPSPPPPSGWHRTQWCCGWVSPAVRSRWAPRTKFGKTDYMEFWNNNKNFKLGKIREMSVAGREAGW